MVRGHVDLECSSRALHQDLESIFSEGTLASLGDGALLARFLEVAGDRSGEEQAFEAIVKPGTARWSTVSAAR